MNAQDIIQEIESISCTDPALLPLGNALHQYTRQYQAGELSKEEYLELIQDLHTEQLINAQCLDLAAKERLNTICNVVLQGANMLL